MKQKHLSSPAICGSFISMDNRERIQKLLRTEIQLIVTPPLYFKTSQCLKFYVCLSIITDLFNSISSVKIFYYSFTFSIFLDFGDTKNEKYTFYFLLFILSYKLIILSMSVLSLQYRYVSSLEVKYPIASRERSLGLQEVHTIGT